MRRVSLVVLAVVAAGCPGRTLDVAKEGEGDGVVASSDGAIDCGGTCAGALQVPVTLTATPDDDSDFASWDCALYDDAAATSARATVSTLEPTIEIGAADVASDTGPLPPDRIARAACTASFSAEPLLTVVVTGPGTVTGDAIDCPDDCEETVERGLPVELTADPGANRFVGWSQGCTGTATTTTVTVNAPTVCEAVFVDPALRATLTLEVEGAGTFASDPDGIDACTATSGTCAAEFDVGDEVALTGALPDGHTIASWSAGCEGGVVDLDDDVTCTVVVQPPPAAVRWNVFLTKAGTGQGDVASTPAGLACAADCTDADASFTDATTVALAATPNATSTLTATTCGCTISGVAPGTVTCASTGGTSDADRTIQVSLNGLDDARGADVVVRLDCTATFAAN